MHDDENLELSGTEEPCIVHAVSVTLTPQHAYREGNTFIKFTFVFKFYLLFIQCELENDNLSASKLMQKWNNFSGKNFCR